jgi:predicted pyridoxine 5'-phosphate oxidase superfamily flavin-nucleotide-binding protein
MYQPRSVITTADEIKALLGPVFETQVARIIDHIDPHCRAWIERCPFIVISSIDATGAMDVSPKGDPPGFVKVLARGRARQRNGTGRDRRRPPRSHGGAGQAAGPGPGREVKEAFFHCGKSMIRSGLWEPERWAPIDGLPTYAQALKDHGKLAAEVPEIERRIVHSKVHRLY